MTELPAPPVRISLHQNPACGRTNVGLTIKNNEQPAQGVMICTADARALAYTLLEAAARADWNGSMHGYLEVQKPTTPYFAMETIILDDNA